MTTVNPRNPAYLIPSKYMVAEDFGHDGVPLEPRATIARIEQKDDGRGWPLLHFKEKWAKPLRINATHRRALCLMFADDDWDKWVGKRIDFRVVRGNFPQGKTTAVRIKGSPDITRTFTFEVQKFGSRDKDHYTLVPTGANVVLGPGLVRFGQKAGHWGKPFSDFDDGQLAELITYAEQLLVGPEAAKKSAKVIEDLQVNVRELKAELAARAAPPVEPELLEVDKAPDPADQPID